MKQFLLQKKILHSEKGVSLIEILMVVAIVVSLAGIGAPIYQSFMIKNDLDIATSTVAQSIRRAQVLSQSSFGDSSWGVYIESGSIIVFKGTDYVSRDAQFDELYTVSTAVTPSGVSEVVFDKYTGLTSDTGTITFTTTTNQVKIVTINEKGNVDF